MHRPVLFNKTFTMKREDLFEGAIVLAKELDCKKRTRHEVVEIYETSVKLRSRMKYNSFFYARIEHLKPAKITRKSLKECGFEDPIFKNCKGKCYLYTGTKVHLLLKDSACGNKIGNVLQVPWEHKQVRYMHEVQREVAKLRIKDYLK